MDESTAKEFRRMAITMAMIGMLVGYAGGFISGYITRGVVDKPAVAEKVLP